MIEKTGNNRQTRPVASSVPLSYGIKIHIEWFGTDNYIELTHYPRLQENIFIV